MFETIGAMAVDIKGSATAVLTKAKDFGCNAVEMVVSVNMGKADIPAAKKAVAETGVKIIAFNQIIKGLSSFDENEVEVGREQYHNLLDFCVEFEAPFAVIYCFFEDEDGVDEAIRQFVRNTRSLVDRATNERITMVLENEPSGITNDPCNIVRIVQQVNSPFFRVNFDPDNFYNGGVEPVPYAYEILKEHVAYVHAKDSCHYVEDLHGAQEYVLQRAFPALCVPLGEGAVNWEGICRSLARESYDGPVVIETHIRPQEVDEGFRKGVAYLKRFREES